MATGKDSENLDFLREQFNTMHTCFTQLETTSQIFYGEIKELLYTTKECLNNVRNKATSNLDDFDAAITRNQISLLLEKNLNTNNTGFFESKAKNFTKTEESSNLDAHDADISRNQISLTSSLRKALVSQKALLKNKGTSNDLYNIVAPTTTNRMEKDIIMEKLPYKLLSSQHSAMCETMKQNFKYGKDLFQYQRGQALPSTGIT